MNALRQRITRAAAALGLSLALVACAPIQRNHGYVPTERDLAAIEVGVDTRETVAAAVGRPGAEGVLDDAGWYYVRSRFRQFGPIAPREVSREGVAISFDTTGRVANIERFDLSDGRVVVLSRRVTDSTVQGIGFFEQLLGNIGRVSADQFIQ